MSHRKDKNILVMTKMFSRFQDLRCLSQPCMRCAKDLNVQGGLLIAHPFKMESA